MYTLITLLVHGCSPRPTCIFAVGHLALCCAVNDPQVSCASLGEGHLGPLKDRSLTPAAQCASVNCKNKQTHVE